MAIRSDLSAPAAATLGYLRRARRIRARLGHDRCGMHRKLRELAAAEATVGSNRATVRRGMRLKPGTFPTQAHPAVAEAFAAEVERAMEGPLLRYSRRAKLLRSALRLGIGRFEANLIIATVQHRHPPSAPRAPRAPRNAQCRWWAPAIAFATLQALILLGVWWVVGA